MTQYIYLVQAREFIKTKEAVYKIGMTTMENYKRFKNYPKGSILLFHMACINAKRLETSIINIFDNKFKRMYDIGREYYEGDPNSMIEIIYTSIKDERLELKQKEEGKSNIQIISEITSSNISEFSDNFHEESKLNVNNKLELKQEEGKLNEIIYSPDIGEFSESDNYFDEDSDFSDNSDNSDNSEIYEFRYNKICSEICNVFPDYRNDESFEGKKKYIKLDSENNVYYLSDIRKEDITEHYHEKCESVFCEHIIKNYYINPYVGDELQYFNMLINKKIIEVGKIYDINDKAFVKKLNKSKFNINIEKYQEIGLKNDEIKYCAETYAKIRSMFHCNTIINKNFYVTRITDSYRGFKDIFRKLTKFDYFNIDIGLDTYNILKIYKINAKFYFYEAYLRKYIPYTIRPDKEKNYCILNRDYEYIGLTIKEFKENEEYKSYSYKKDHKGPSVKSYEEGIRDEYLFDDGTAPWHDKQHLKAISDKYEKIIKEKNLKVCLNINEFTLDILSLSKSL